MYQYFRLLRVYQWIKNLVIFAGLIFAGKLLDSNAIVLSISTFFLFSFIASSVYIINDILDYERDKIHPTKKDRPIASGTVSFATGWSFAIALAFFSLSIAFFLNTSLCIILFSYLLLNLAYTKVLKDTVLLDVICISAGFILRIFAGTVVLGVAASNWLVLCTFFFTLFLGLAKRKNELHLCDKLHKPSDFRGVLKDYSNGWLDVLIGVSTTVTVVFYTLYTIDDTTIRHFGSNELIYTVPFVIFGIFRYLYLIYQKHEGADPTLIAIEDVPIISTVLGWIVFTIAVIYW